MLCSTSCRCCCNTECSDCAAQCSVVVRCDSISLSDDMNTSAVLSSVRSHSSHTVHVHNFVVAGPRDPRAEQAGPTKAALPPEPTLLRKLWVWQHRIFALAMLGLAYFNIHEGLEFKSLSFEVTWQRRVLIYVAGATAGAGLLLEVLRLVVPKCFAQRDRGGAIPAGMTVAYTYTTVH
jgi:hypothetical protein